MKNMLYLLLVLIIFSCDEPPMELNPGHWKAELKVQDNELLPFIFQVLNKDTLVIHNAEERIYVDEIQILGDSIRIQTPVFEGFFKGKFNQNGSIITGDFIKPSLNRVVPFKMIYGDSLRFRESVKPSTNITGNWETVFSPQMEDSYIAKGIFKQKGNAISGTFRTTTGDYRYLEGTINGNQFKLSTFDGAHAFLFKGEVNDSSMQGNFYSGNHWKEPFVAKRNANYELPKATSLTYLKNGYDKVSFAFPDVSGHTISIEDKVYKGKVVLVQILGSWCPNCLEETQYYVDYLNENPNTDLEIIGLAFEYAPTQEKAFASIERLKERLKVPYPILLAQYGTEDKKLANEKLPMLNHVLSYPTTIFIDKKGSVRRIHTGFNGKATGQKFFDYKVEFEQFVKSLLSE